VGLSDEESLVRYTAVQDAVASGPEELVDLIAPLLFDQVSAIRMEAAVRLAGVDSTLLKPYQRDALRETLDEYIHATEYSLDFAFAGHNLGNLYARLGDRQKAIEYYSAAIAIDGLFFPAKVNLAMLYNASGRNPEAERLLREVVEEHPGQYEAMYSLGLLLAEMGRTQESAEWIAQAADGMPSRSRLRYNLGLLQQQLGALDAAEASLSRALELDPENIDYLYALADHYLKRGQPQKALPLAERMIASHPRLEIGYQIKAHIQGSTGPRR
jgi:tetratricopeptide (TPR) repeat protein